LRPALSDQKCLWFTECGVLDDSLAGKFKLITYRKPFARVLTRNVGEVKYYKSTRLARTESSPPAAARPDDA
jgi:hypothetical protein